MKKRWTLTALGFLLVAFFAAVPARSADVDQRIRALEDELTRLKSEQAQVKTEQIEMRKEATAAAAALPEFNYRPGAGLAITAADQSWGLRFGYELALDFMKLQGEDQFREGDFGIFGRRNRPQFTYTWDRGFYEFAAELDMDGDETGTKEALLQRACFRTRFEQINPFFPSLQFGMDCSGAGSRYRSSEMTLELPMLDRNNGFNTGSHTGVGVTWGNLPALGLPGSMQFNYYWVVHGMGRSDGLKDQSNKADHVAMFNINPFSEVKNKWISGLGWSMFAWFGNIDDRVTANNGANSARTFQLRTQEGSTRLAFFTTPNQGEGLHTFLSPSFQWKVGPYQLNYVAGFDSYNNQANGRPNTTGGRASAYYWKFMNDLMVWSPKGFLTGAPNEEGTLGLGYSWERTFAQCGANGCDAATAKATIQRTVGTVKEVGLRYWIRPSLSVWLAVKNYDFSNSPLVAQKATTCDRTPTDEGKSCSFTDAVVRFYWVY
jgi:hypothetical protein